MSGGLFDILAQVVRHLGTRITSSFYNCKSTRLWASMQFDRQSKRSTRYNVTATYLAQHYHSINCVNI